MMMFKHGDRVLHARLEETGTVVEDEALPRHEGEVWVRFDGRAADDVRAVSGHLLTRLREQRVAVSTYDWDLLVSMARTDAPDSRLMRSLLAGIVERSERIE